MSAELPTPREATTLPTVSDVQSIRPRNDNVLIRLEPVRVMSGLIELPSTAKVQGNRPAVVLAAGPKADGLEAGMRVLVGQDPGWEMGGDPNVRMLRVGAIIAVLGDDTKVGS